MDKKLLTAKGRLRWFLDLINAKIETLSISETIKLWEQIREIAYGSLGLSAIQGQDLGEWKKKREELRQIQAVLSDALQKVLSVFKKPKKVMIRPSFKWDEDMERAAHEIDLPNDIAIASESIILSKTTKKPISKWAEDYIALSFKLENIVLVGSGKVAVVTPKVKDKLFEQFIIVLGHFPPASIQRCQRDDCGAYFLKATKKEKRYCSNRCVWVIASRERRKKEPEKEREKKRESYYRRRRREREG